MSTTLAAGSSVTVSLDPFGTITLVVPGKAALDVNSLADNLLSSSRVSNARSQTYGPYGVPVDVTITAVDRSLQYTVVGKLPMLETDATTGATYLVSADGNLVALGELAVPVTLTATGTAKTGACEFGGFVVRAVSGTVNVTVYDATSATGTPIMTSAAVALGAYPWNAGRWRENTTGCHVVIGGGGTVTLDVLAQ